MRPPLILAARPYTKAPAYAPAPIYNWTGFYIGGHVGGAFGGSNNILAPGFITNSNDGRFMGGGQIGYDTQFSPNWVFGIEANYSFLDTGSNFANRGLGSVTGRLGYTWGPALLYVKGGYGWADSRFTNGFAGNGGRDGYTVGGGLEYLFTQNWSGKVEYQYYDFGNVNFVGPVASRRHIPQRPAHHQGRPELSLQLGCSDGRSACPGILITLEPRGSEIEKGRHLMPALFALSAEEIV